MILDDDPLLRIKMRDTEDVYPWWCQLFGHQWFRYAYTTQWRRDRTCRRCENVPPPWPPRRH